ncbi:hypothetical protein ACFYOK_35995 [Microbispora bryophytorum]|uniref:hypothetical protein n=1 Tax=Microbispora bryophytorum TaxID=1460882 RepID=UPI0033C10AFE
MNFVQQPTGMSDEVPGDKPTFRVGIVGRYKAGKSPLLNALVETVRDVLPPIVSDDHVEKIAAALAKKLEAAALAERPRQRRREWMLLLIGLIAGAILSMPIGIWVNSIS